MASSMSTISVNTEEKCIKCNRRVTNGKKCRVCEVLFIHNNCATAMGYSSDEESLKCETCSLPNLKDSSHTVVSIGDGHETNSKDILMDNLVKENSNLINENLLLKKLVKEMDDKYELLLFKIDVLEGKCATQSEFVLPANPTTPQPPAATNSQEGVPAPDPVGNTTQDRRSPALPCRIEGAPSFQNRYQNRRGQRPGGKTQHAGASKQSQNKQSSANLISVVGGPSHDKSVDKIRNNSGINKLNISNHNGTNNRAIMVVGNRKYDDALYQPAPSVVSFHVSRFKPEATEEMVKALFRDTFPEIQCEKITSKYPNSYSSFKVSIFESNRKQFLDPEIWPAGIIVSRFFSRRRKLSHLD